MWDVDGMRLVMFALRSCLVVGWLVVVSSPAGAVVGGDPAAPPVPDSAVVFTQKYGHSARLEGFKNDERGYYTFLGIRFVELRRTITKVIIKALNYLPHSLSATGLILARLR